MSASQPQSSPVSNRPRRSGVLIKVTLVLAVAFALLLAYSLWIEPYRVEVVHTEIQGNLASPIKIAHISDLHTHGLRLRERTVIAILNEEKPDIILKNAIAMGAFVAMRKGGCPDYEVSEYEDFRHKMF